MLSHLLVENSGERLDLRCSQSSAIHLKYSDHLKFLVLKCINGHAALRHYAFQGLLFCFVLSCMYFFNLEKEKSFKMYEILFLKQRREQ